MAGSQPGHSRHQPGDSQSQAGQSIRPQLTGDLYNREVYIDSEHQFTKADVVKEVFFKEDVISLKIEARCLEIHWAGFRDVSILSRGISGFPGGFKRYHFGKVDVMPLLWDDLVHSKSPAPPSGARKQLKYE